MLERLVIYIKAKDNTHPAWAVVDATGAVRQVSLNDTTDGLAQIADGKEVIVLVPAEDVLLTSATLPRMSRTKLMQALPYALEEQLIDDVETLHFAAGDFQADQSLPVAIVSQTKMQEWIHLLQSWSISADYFISATLALPFTENTWSIFINEIAIARTANYLGFACDRSNLSTMLDVALATTALPPQLIHIQNDSSHAFASALTTTIPVKEEFTTPEQMISTLACTLQPETTINLLQGAFAVKKSRLPQLNKVWQIAMYLGVAWISLLFLSPIVSSFILSTRASDIEDQIAAIYKRNFPQAHDVVAPKLRMQDKLQKMSADIGEHRALLLLGYIGKALQAGKSVKLQRLDFQNNQMSLMLTAANSDDFSAFTNFLTQQGLTVKQQNATLNGERINATVAIE